MKWNYHLYFLFSLVFLLFFLLPQNSYASDLVSFETNSPLDNTWGAVNTMLVGFYNFSTSTLPITDIYIKEVKQATNVSLADDNIYFILYDRSPATAKDCKTITQLRSAWGIPNTTPTTDYSSAGTIPILHLQFTGTECVFDQLFDIRIIGLSNSTSVRFHQKLGGTGSRGSYTTWAGGTPTGGGFNIPTSITSFTYSTTTETARVKGYWNATTTTGITERLQFHQFSTLLGIESFNEVIATTTGNFDLSFSFLSLPTPATGTTTVPFVADTVLFAEIYQYDNNYGTDPFSGVFDSRYKTLLVATTTTISTLTGINIATSTRSLFAYPEYECSITSLTGCFKNALIWAFYPTQDGIEQYYSFVNLIESKTPVGYFFVARDSIQGLNKDGTPSTTLAIPYSLKRYIFDPFDIGISSILWVFFLFNFYKRLKFITI